MVLRMLELKQTIDPAMLCVQPCSPNYMALLGKFIIIK